ncbi:post-GPI attachment to proteins factor 2-like [Aplysia californica]|uniref:Post-GPI attachment to proteins factor 2-like n=1 Tax=Aplysia californica TaxID=6500 RepID=A0ABM0JRU0_APLCA|nr:post-GPI attachment to proteins factor 2-like [Aplysia californica]
MGKDKRKGTVDELNMNIPIWTFAVVTVGLPGVSLALCFITGFIFRFDDVNETMCEVKNYIPSISAVTGITPQTYVWRTCIALHAAPRFAVTLIYYNYYLARIQHVPSHRVGLFKFLIKLNFWLNFVENSCLVLVAYITNRENYPVHEKIFVVFMVTSLCYMLLNTIIYKWTRGPEMSETENRSYWWKKAMFVSISAATIGLIFFFIQHRLFCVVGAFSMFSVCEYVIAYTNMAYHFTGYLDFKGQSLMFGQLQREGDNHNSNGTALTDNSNGTALTNNNKDKAKVH